MGKSNQLHFSDIESVFALVQECRELWADTDAWQHHLLRGACRLTGTAVGHYNELRFSSDHTAVEVLDETESGWRDDTARSHFMRMLTDHPNRLEFLPRCIHLAGTARELCDATALRPEMRPDREWRLSQMFNEYRRPAHVDGYVMSFCLNRDTGSLIMLCLSQDISDRAPTRRAKAVLALLNRQIGPLVGKVLVTNAQLGVGGLSPRLRQTIEGLLAGEAEKQIAARLALSEHTVHEYVGLIYREFDVTSRPELMAYFLRRRPEPFA